MRRVVTARGSRFVLCERSRTDPSFPRYPRLPVTDCAGFEPGSPGESQVALDASDASLLDSADIPKNGL